MCSIKPCPGECIRLAVCRKHVCFESDGLFIFKWLGTGVPGCHGALVVKRVAKGCRQDCDCATILHPPLTDHHVKDLTLRHKCAMRGIVLVSGLLIANIYSTGELYEVRNFYFFTFLTVDGKWSSWVSWGACSVSCGGGTRQRTRICASPAPQHGGRQCEGNDIHIDFCNNEPCPSKLTHSLLHKETHTYE